jgi:pimeloyl-ACP methyl ester carboxylesterase
MNLLFTGPLFDAELLRTLSHACYGGADINECIATADRITEDDLESWYKEWNQTAERAQALAEASLSGCHGVSAREAYLRASNYFRTSGVFLAGTPVDSRLIRALDRQAETFRLAAELLTPAFEPITVPYEGTTLPGYFVRAAEGGEPRPTIIITGGHDSTAEELYFWNGAAALRRGYNCLCFDGPGQGRALLKQELYFRPDWENVTRPFVDYALGRADVDKKRLAIMGTGFGGYLAPRAASQEPRFVACVADPGIYDLLGLIKNRLPPIIRDQLPNGNRAALAMVEMLLNRAARHPLKGFELRRNAWVHGAATPLAYARASAEYSLATLTEKIRCPTLICAAENDPSAALAEQLHGALTSKKQLIVFTNAEGAGERWQSGYRTLFHQRAFDWLGEVFRTVK